MKLEIGDNLESVLIILMLCLVVGTCINSCWKNEDIKVQKIIEKVE
jgi:hypothetical protein